MNLVEKLAIWAMLRPRVEHSLPGRLRLHIPALKRIPEDQVQAVDLLERLFRVPNGVQAVKFDLRSGSVLIDYDAGVTTEEDIMAFLGGVMALLREHWRGFTNVPNGQVIALADRLEKWLAGIAHSQAFLKHKLRIPDDVWP
jgi:hypothetical protein